MELQSGLKLYAVSLKKDMPDKVFANMLTYVEHNKAQKLKQMKPEIARLSLIGILLAKHAIHQKWKLPIQEIQFGVGAYGKPFVIGHEHMYFNISHSGCMCVCAVDDTPVGVDIQKMDHRNFEGIVKRFFTLEEQQCFANQGSDLHAFYRMWTQRESVGKYLGKGFHYKKEDDTADWKVNHTIYQNKYMLCICTKKHLIYT